LLDEFFGLVEKEYSEVSRPFTARPDIPDAEPLATLDDLYDMTTNVLVISPGAAPSSPPPDPIVGGDRDAPLERPPPVPQQLSPPADPDPTAKNSLSESLLMSGDKRAPDAFPTDPQLNKSGNDAIETANSGNHQEKSSVQSPPAPPRSDVLQSQTAPNPPPSNSKFLFSVRSGPLKANLVDVYLEFPPGATISDAESALEEHYALQGYLVGFFRKENLLPSDEPLTGNDPIEVCPIVVVEYDRSRKPVKLFSGTARTTVRLLLDHLTAMYGLPRDKLFLHLPDSDARLDENLSLRSFSYNGGEKVLVVGGMAHYATDESV
jgi:hypothetical protein